MCMWLCVMWFIYTSHTHHIDITYASHTHHIRITYAYTIHTQHIRITYITYASHTHTQYIDNTYSSHTQHIRITYASHTHYIYNTYASHTHRIRITYTSHAHHIHITYSSHTITYTSHTHNAPRHIAQARWTDVMCTWCVCYEYGIRMLCVFVGWVRCSCTMAPTGHRIIIVVVENAGMDNGGTNGRGGKRTTWHLGNE